MRIHFLGAARTVTGSQYLLETDRARVLVDCGMFQGSPHDAVRNRVPFAYDAKGLDALLLTHAHLDHCGLIPHLVGSGFSSPVYAVEGTVDLTRLVLLDSAKLQEEFAQSHQRFARRHPDRAEAEDRAAAAELATMTGDPEQAARAARPEAVTFLREPLYTTKDATNALALFRGVGYGVETLVAPGVAATFLDAGHILGSAIVKLRVHENDQERTIVFSGDLGRPNTPIIRDPTAVGAADYLLVESTYGGRVHEPREEAIRMLGEAVSATSGARGVLLMPSFAIGRTQEIVYELDRLLAAGTIPHMPLYLDSPMAQKASAIYRTYASYFDTEARALLAGGEEPLDYPGAVVANDIRDSLAIEQAARPVMVVASNGMITGGRIVRHVKALVGDPGMTLLFIGYQGVGTLGAELQQGAKNVRIDGTDLEVRCQVRSIDGFSAHADEPELLAWLGHFTQRPRRTFIVHGDPGAQAAFEPKVASLGFSTLVPQWRQAVELE
ncbi:MAG: MBL fold metallo-hydrolase [Chloroflexota bacterium]|nr:MBL fold metallo-hydrolase [Chloroflexota bacterium]